MKLLACLIIALAVALTGCDSLTKTSAPTPPEPSAQIRLAELAAIKAQNEAQMETQKRLAAIQLDVIKRCADGGNVPVILNGNVDCKILK